METHGLKFVVDTTGVQKGFRDFGSAVDGIFGKLDKFEAHVEKTMASIAKSANNKRNVSAFVKSFEGLNNIKVDSAAARKLSVLSSAMSGFKAPTTAQIANTKKFFAALAGLPDLGSAFKSINNIAHMNVAFDRFSAPSATQSKNLRAFGAAALAAAPGLQALSKISGISGIANELATISIAMKGMKVPNASQVKNLGGMAHALRQFNFANLQGATGLYSLLGTMGRFRAPSASQIKNLQSFIHAVSNLTIPRNASQVASALTQIARAAGVANGALGGLRGNLGGLNGNLARTGAQAKQASLHMMGLQNAFSGTFQVGSALRSLLGSLTIGEVGRNFFEATNAALSFNAGMGVISKEAGFADKQLNFVRETSRALGLDMLGTQESYMKFAISVDKAGGSVGQAQNILKGFGTAMTVLGTSAERQKDVFLALQQVMNKGYLGSEELMQQINEHLPGAIGYLKSEVLSLTKGKMDLTKALEDKALDGTQALLFLAKKYRDEFGKSLPEAMQRPATQMQILKNNINDLYQAIGKNGANKAFAGFLAKISSYMSPDNVNKFAEAIGSKLAVMMDKAGRAADYLYQNWDKIKGPLGTVLGLVGKWMILTATVQIGKALVSPFVNLYSAVTTVLPKLKEAQTLIGALAAGNIATPVAAGGGAALSGGFAATLAVVNKLKMAVGANGGVFGLIRAGLSSVTGLIPGVVTGIAGLAAVIGGSLAAAWGIGKDAAKDAGLQMASDQYTTGEIIKGIWITMGEQASKVWNTASDWIAEKTKWLELDFGIKLPSIGELFAKTAFTAYYVFTKAIEGIIRAVASMALTIGNTFSTIGGIGGDIVSGEFGAAASKAKGLVMGKALTDGFKAGFKGMEFGGADMKAQYAKVGAGASVVSSWLATQGAKGRKANAPPALPKLRGDKGSQDLAKLYDDGNAADQYDSSKLITPGKVKKGKGKKGKKGPKGPSAASQERSDDSAQDAIRRAADSIVSKFAEDDPFLKLKQDLISDVGSIADGLFDSKTFQKWKDGISKGSGDAANQIEALIKQMDAAGTSTKVLADLETRYGITKQDLIDKMRTMGRLSDENAKRMKEERALGYAAMKQERDNLELARLSNREQEIAGKLLEMVKDFNEKNAKTGVKATQDMIDARRAELEVIYDQNDALNRQRELMENNGIRQYIGSIQNLGETVSNFDKNILQNLEDSLYKFGTTGKLSFKGVIAGMQHDLIRSASQGLTKKFAQMMNPSSFDADGNMKSGSTPSFGSALFKRLGLGDSTKVDQGNPNKDKLLGLQQSNPMYVWVVNPDGTLSVGGAPGSSAGAAGAIGSAIGSLFDSNGARTSVGTSPISSAIGSLFDASGARTSAGTGSIADGLPMAQIANDFASTFRSANSTVAGDFAASMGQANNGIASSFGNILNSLMSSLGGGGAGGAGGGLGGLMSGGGIGGGIGAGGGGMGGMGGGGGINPGMVGMAVNQIGGALSKKKGVLGYVGQFMNGGLLGVAGRAIGGKTGRTISKVAGGINQIASMAMMGGFKEGGIVGHSVGPKYAMHPAAFAGAPHYKEGTANTSGGIPAVLHDNEAVIPLSRGRKVPVHLNDNGRGGNTSITFNVSSPDADSFKKSKSQLASQAYAVGARAARRNR
jgi:tape measure domain-containing protein